MSVRLRLTLWNVGIVAFVLFTLGVVVRFTTQAAISASLDRDLQQRAKLFGAHWARFDRDRLNVPPWYKPGKPPPGPPPGPPPNQNNAFARFWPRTLDTQGHPYLPWANDKPWDSTLVELSARGQQIPSSTWIGQVHVRVLSFPLYKEGRIVGVMQVASSLEEMDRALTSLSTTMLMLSPLALLACGLVGAFITGRAMRPVRTIAQASGRIGAGNLSERLPVIGNDDFAELAVIINGMLGRLEQSFTRLEEAFDQQRRFTADASHELRTPLTAIKGNVSLALSAERPAAEYRKALEVTNRAADNMNRIVQDLLFLARSDARQLPLDLRPINMAELLHAAVESVQDQAHAPILISTPEPLPSLCGDRNHLLRVLVNLLVNAIRHTPIEGTIVLSAKEDGGRVNISVQDSGEGIAPEHLPHVCDRFYRVDASRTRALGGTGLGLSICQCLVEAHGGALRLASTVGVGTTATISLPYALHQSEKQESVCGGRGTLRARQSH